MSELGLLSEVIFSASHTGFGSRAGCSRGLGRVESALIVAMYIDYRVPNELWNALKDAERLFAEGTRRTGAPAKEVAGQAQKKLRAALKMTNALIEASGAAKRSRL